MSIPPNESEVHYLPSRRQLFRLPRRYPLPYGWGMASLCLAFIGLALCIFPVLGVPISSFALFCGLVGFVVSLPRSGVTLRWSLMGLALSGSALAINVAITFAPTGYVPGRNVEPIWQPPEKRPYVSPPSSSAVVPEIGVKASNPAGQAKPD
jgi:hypothetical protein